ncbi:M48 family metallopeptidase [Sphingomonas lacunae]|uniref:M48 family metallopeptidase n=2 Tax=Sphingomonas lacunae TaxID=2698828 RepID=A0A6M4AWW5_9SPHN|nr:M48 family metallopeptidase [Sphingomonas lacunae]
MTGRKAALAVAGLALLLPGAAWAAQAGGAFDPDAATDAYMATLRGAARAKSDAYFEGGYWLILWGALVSIASELVILRTGLSARFRDWAERWGKWRWLQTMLWVLPYGIVSSLIVAPWTIYTEFVREDQYGLMNQTFVEWLGDAGIMLAINIVFLAIGLAIIMGLIRKFPKSWWLWGAGAMTAMAAFAALIVPVFINPLFNTYTELDQGPVRDRIVAMAESQNVPAEHIYLFDASKQTKRISANVSGLGPTIRISLNDNLLNRTSLPETAAVMGHELGHYVLSHVYKMIGAFALIFGLLFFAASRMVPAMINRWGSNWRVRGPDDVAAIPVYMIALGALSVVMTPLTNSIIRWNESEADAFGLDVAREPDGFAQAAMRLSEYRKIEPGALEEILFYDHPSGRTRVQMSMDWKARHWNELSPESRAAGPGRPAVAAPAAAPATTP